MSTSTSHLTGPGPDEILTQTYWAVQPPAPPTGSPAIPPAGPPSGKEPFLRRRWVKVTGAVVGGFAAGCAIMAAAGGSHPASAAPGPKATHSAPAKPAHHPAAGPAAASAVPAGYATDILNAGITAPVSWINATGQKIVADWRAGDTAAWTDANVLTPGGVYPYHLATFDQVTARDFGVTPPAQGTQPATPPAPAAPATSQPAAPATQAPPPAGPTVSEQQALDDAQSYLNMGSGFSRDGLIGQLEFDKFSAADATWAADNSGADWNAQAVDDAQGYMKMGGFSRDSLISQLEFDKFTYAQATYAANQVGL